MFHLSHRVPPSRLGLNPCECFLNESKLDSWLRVDGVKQGRTASYPYWVGVCHLANSRCVFNVRADYTVYNVYLSFHFFPQERDPILDICEDFVMAGRVATILRGLAYAIKHKPSVAELWAPQARILLDKYD